MKIPRIDHTFHQGDSIFFRIRTSTQNPFERLLGKFHSALPYGVDIDSLSDEKTLKNLEAATGRKVHFEVGRRGVNVMYRINRLDATDGIPDKVLFGKVIEWFPDEDIHKTPWAAGVTADRVIEWFNFEDQPHILIAGSTQSGKSNHVNQMIATLVTTSTPEQVRLLLVDNKGGIEFTHWQGIRHAIKGMVKRAEDVLPGWIKTNMVMRISGKMPADSASRVILDSGTAATLPPIPGRMVFSLGRIEVIAQSPYISSDEIAKAVSLSREYPEPSDREFTTTAALHVREKFSQTDLLRIAIDELGGALGAEGIHKAAGGNDIVTLRQLRAMIDTVKISDQLRHNGTDYTVVKIRRGFYLQPVEQAAMESSTEQKTALSA